MVLTFIPDYFGRRVLIFPKGNNVDNLSMYLDVADSSTLPYGWSRYAQFSLAVVNQIHTKFTMRKGMSVLHKDPYNHNKLIILALITIFHKLQSHNISFMEGKVIGGSHLLCHLSIYMTPAKVS